MLPRITLAALACTALTACASIMEGQTDKVNVSAEGAPGAVCDLKNGRGEARIGVPSAVEVKKSKTDLEVKCAEPQSGAHGSAVVASAIEPWVIGNILFGGLIGLGIDFGTGSAWQYPADIRVAMQPAGPEHFAAPVEPVAVEAPAPMAAPEPAPQPAPAAPAPRPAYVPGDFSAPPAGFVRPVAPPPPAKSL